MSNEAKLSVIFGEIDKIQDITSIDRIYEMLNNRTTAINRKEAGSFRLGQYVKFKSDKGGIYEGHVESIGRTGRIKVKLINNLRYSHYTMGAGFLKDNLIEL